MERAMNKKLDFRIEEIGKALEAMNAQEANALANQIKITDNMAIIQTEIQISRRLQRAKNKVSQGLSAKILSSLASAELREQEIRSGMTTTHTEVLTIRQELNLLRSEIRYLLHAALGSPTPSVASTPPPPHPPPHTRASPPALPGRTTHRCRRGNPQ